MQDDVWFWFGRALAVANLVYFSINLFGFLIPRFLPRSFKRYFLEAGGETHAKMAEDRKPCEPAGKKSQPPVDKKGD